MKRGFVPLVVMLSTFGFSAGSGFASTLPNMDPVPAPGCTASACTIFEGILYQLPYAALAGDVVLLDRDGSISDVVHFSNNIIDTGGGTGFGDLVFEFNWDEPFPLSANAVFIPEVLDRDGVARTLYYGNGTLYTFVGGVPEPSSMWLLGSGAAILLIRRRAGSRG